MPDLERGAAMWKALLKEGLYANLARPPATPAGMTLLRCSLCAEHSSEEVETILGMFERADRAIREQREQPLDVVLDEVDAGRFERLEEARRQAQADDIVAP